MESREELIREILSDVEKQDEWDEKKLMSCKEEVIQRILSNIEKESEFWDEEELADDNGWYALVENVFKSICGSIYAEMHRKMELPEDILQISLEESKKYFFCDCILVLAQYYNITWLHEESKEEVDEKISFSNIYNIFVRSSRQLILSTFWHIHPLLAYMVFLLDI